MAGLTFFDLKFAGSGALISQAQREEKRKMGVDDEVTVEEDFYKFFYSNNLLPLFTNEHRTESIDVSLVNAQSVLKSDGKGGQARKVLLEFAKWLNMGMDNMMYESEVFKLIWEAKTWDQFLKRLTVASEYMQTILPNYLHNIWNIAWYDKDKSGTRASGVF